MTTIDQILKPTSKSADYCRRPAGSWRFDLLAVLLALWMTDVFHMQWFGVEISAPFAALLGAVIVLFPRYGVLQWSEAEITWHLLIFSAGAYAGGLALDDTGAAAILSEARIYSDAGAVAEHVEGQPLPAAALAPGATVMSWRGIDGGIAAASLVLLEDDKHDQPIYAPVPIVRESVLKSYPGIAEAVRPLMQSFTRESLQALNARVQIDGESGEEVAADYLRDRGFIRPAAAH